MKIPGLEFTLSPRKVWLFGHRYHHGLYGCWRVATGIALMALDWHDRRVWLRDFMTHPDWNKR